MRTGHDGYTLVELMAAVAIMVILAVSAISVFTGYVDRAREIHLIETACLIRQAIAVYEAENGGPDGVSGEKLMAEMLWIKPNSQRSGLYPYVGEVTKNCTKFDLSYTSTIGSFMTSFHRITGFEYGEGDYVVSCDFRENTIEITGRPDASTTKDSDKATDSVH